MSLAAHRWKIADNGARALTRVVIKGCTALRFAPKNSFRNVAMLNPKGTVRWHRLRVPDLTASLGARPASLAGQQSHPLSKRFRLSKAVSTIVKTLGYLEQLRAWNVVWRSYYAAVPRHRERDDNGIVLSVLSAVAQQERITLSERTKAGLQRAKRAGKKLGRRAVSVDLVGVERCRADGLGLRTIAAKLGSASIRCRKHAVEAEIKITLRSAWVGFWARLADVCRWSDKVNHESITSHEPGSGPLLYKPANAVSAAFKPETCRFDLFPLSTANRRAGSDGNQKT
jgi:Resolvase, N terminal domain